MSSEKSKLLKYLKSQHTMYLATYDGRPWVSTVFYAVDEKFNFYCIGPPESRHNKAIKKYKHVSFAIAASNQKTTDKKIGVQVEGIADEVNSRNKIKIILALWNKFNPGFESVINLPSMIKKLISSHVYEIKPRYIKFFNEELYGDEGTEIFKF